ncbi:hypothetical protein BU17DRAFT_72286 [Hysterangium stoloniferum]|nr:hypothetical protein BU17DRAFT_72286 [Hysterangium stoloniferum]
MPSIDLSSTIHVGMVDPQDASLTSIKATIVLLSRTERIGVIYFRDMPTYRRLGAEYIRSNTAATLVMGDLGSTVWYSSLSYAGTSPETNITSQEFRKQWSRGTIITVVVVGWSFVLLLTLLGPLRLATEAKGPFFSIAGTWCFISSEYAVSRLLLHYVPLFIASAVILVLYGLVFLVMRGTINVKSHSPQRSSLPPNDAFARHRVVIAKRMLWYPIGKVKNAYLTAVMPIAVIRLLGLKEERVPEGAWILGMSFLFALGAVDAVIYTWTRHLITSLSPATQMQAFRLSLALAARSGKPETEDTSSLNPMTGSDRSLVPSQVSSPITEKFRSPMAEKSDVDLPSMAKRVKTETMEEVV